MENTLLHAQKTAILERLIKADQITLDEALTLLKEEPATTIQPWPLQPYYPTPGTGNPYWWSAPTWQVSHGQFGTFTVQTN